MKSKMRFRRKKFRPPNGFRIAVDFETSSGELEWVSAQKYVKENLVPFTVVTKPLYAIIEDNAKGHCYIAPPDFEPDVEDEAIKINSIEFIQNLVADKSKKFRIIYPNKRLFNSINKQRKAKNKLKTIDETASHPHSAEKLMDYFFTSAKIAFENTTTDNPHLISPDMNLTKGGFRRGETIVIDAHHQLTTKPEN